MKMRGKIRSRSMAAMAGLIAWTACWPAYAFSDSDRLQLKCVGERSDGFKIHMMANNFSGACSEGSYVPDTKF